MRRGTLVSNPQWILGDVHGGVDPHADRELRALLTAAADRRADLLLMGDLFIAWLGPERFWPPAHRPILDALRSIRARGGRVRLVAGNRDYLADTLVGDVFDAVYNQPTLLWIGGQPTWVLHGDGIVPEDRAYRAWRSLTRNRAAGLVLGALPSAVGQQLPQWAADRLAKRNLSYKTGAWPEDAVRRVARAAAQRGATRCLMGHFHHPFAMACEGVMVEVVPGWTEHRTILEVSPDGLRRREVGPLERYGAVPKT